MVPSWNPHPKIRSFDMAFAPDSTSASRIRYRVVGLAVLLAMITYLDRACIATLAPTIMADLELTKDQMSYVYSAFAISYAAFEIPTASWADRVGFCLVLVWFVVWWLCFLLVLVVVFGFFL